MSMWYIYQAEIPFLFDPIKVKHSVNGSNAGEQCNLFHSKIPKETKHLFQ